jgi:hypothetical protein
MEIIGIPLSVETISAAFIQATDRDRILVSAAYVNPLKPGVGNDYACAAAGFDQLLKLGYVFLHESEFATLAKIDAIPRRCVVCINAWRMDSGARRRAEEATAIVCRFIESLSNLRRDVAYISQGSPHLYDSIVSTLMKLNNFTVIDTASSADLAFEVVKVHSDLPRHTVRHTLTDELKAGFLNVIGCIGSTYDYGPKPPFVAQISQARRIWLVRVGREPFAKQMDANLLLSLIDKRAPELNSMTAVMEIE